MNPVQFGYAGKWTPSYLAVQEAANLVKNGPTPVGVESNASMGVPYYRVVTNNEYAMAAQIGRLGWTALV